MSDCGDVRGGALWGERGVKSRKTPIRRLVRARRFLTRFCHPENSKHQHRALSTAAHPLFVGVCVF